MTSTPIYIVTRGDYSDYSIVGAYLTQEEALHHISNMNDKNFYQPSIEVYDGKTIIKIIEVDNEGKLTLHSSQEIDQLRNKTDLEIISVQSKIKESSTRNTCEVEELQRQISYLETKLQDDIKEIKNAFVHNKEKK